MMHLIPKWRVTIQFVDRAIVFWMYDSHLANVQRKVADMQFTENGLEQPSAIIVNAASEPQQIGVTHSVTYREPDPPTEAG